MEQWKAIPGYEGIYEASTLGQIKSVSPSARYKHRILKQHYCKNKRSSRRDARVTLWKDKTPHYHLVARIIAMTWCDGYQQGMTVNHIDGNPENNEASNLEWVSLKMNIQHGFDTGLYSRNMKPITIEVDGKQVEFQSYAAASRALGHNNGYLSNKLRKRGVAHGQRI